MISLGRSLLCYVKCWFLCR